MILSRTTRVLPLLPVAALAIGACSSDDDAEPTGAPLVVATTTIWADVARNVACDGLADVVSLVPAGADPHDFEPSLRDREEIGGAALVVANGLDLEESLLDVLDTVADEGVPVIAAVDHVTTLDDDPHIWQDPTRVAAAVPAIADGLVDAGLPESEVRACADAYVAELTALDTEIEQLVGTIPDDRRVLVTNHDSLSYFADRYGFEILGTVIPSSSSLAETNPADLEELATAIRDAGVQAIFAETQLPDADAAALAERVGDVEVVTLHTDSLDEEGTDAATYVAMMRSNAEALAAALA